MRWLSQIFFRFENAVSDLRSDYEGEALELRRIAEQVGTRTLLLGTERAASGLLRQADAKVAASTRGKLRQEKGN